jgi:hypothetical protein
VDAGLPSWLGHWCATHLGAPPAEVLLSTEHLSAVFGLRLTDGREVVIKARPDPGGRAATCVAAQAALAEAGLPCPAPLTGVTPVRTDTVRTEAVHAEEWRPGGDLLRGDDPGTARRYAAVYAELAALAELSLPPPLPNPPWLPFDEQDLAWTEPGPVPDFVTRTAARAKARLREAAGWPRVLGHADFEAQNLRWMGTDLWAVFDWDSLAWMPEAVLAGAASAAFASAEQPTLAPVDSSAAFLETYQQRRGRAFTADELQIAWAASLLTATVNAAHEARHSEPPLTTGALHNQAAERLARAGA